MWFIKDQEDAIICLQTEEIKTNQLRQIKAKKKKIVKKIKDIF